MIEIVKKVCMNFIFENEIKNEEPGIWSDLFLEIEEMIEYFFKLEEYDRDLKNPFLREPVNSFYFHKQMSNYIYLFSSLDKITTLIFFHLINIGLEEELKKSHKITVKTKLYFIKHFNILSLFMIEENKKNRFNDFWNNIKESNLWDIISDCRNNWNHNFSHIMDFQNIGLKILILECFVIRICAEIKNDFISGGNSSTSRAMINFCLTKK